MEKDWPDRSICVNSYKMPRASSVALPETGSSTGQDLERLYHVVLLNDEDHTYDYVIEMLQKLFGFGESRALRHAVEVDTRGTTILVTCELERAELKRDQIHAFGPDPRLDRSIGSMAAVVEPATG
jgi:ATP-dependent Clp protease adaptor protein ClpS